MKSDAVPYLVGIEFLVLIWILLSYEFFKVCRGQWRKNREERMLRERGQLLYRIKDAGPPAP
jgi:hypothetical protein